MLLALYAMLMATLLGARWAAVLGLGLAVAGVVPKKAPTLLQGTAGDVAALALIDAFPDWPAPVVALVGPAGTGKTYLAMAMAVAEPDVVFVGRLATYRYYNMDQVVGQALATYRRLRAREQEAPLSVAAA